MKGKFIFFSLISFLSLGFVITFSTTEDQVNASEPIVANKANEKFDSAVNKFDSILRNFPNEETNATVYLETETQDLSNILSDIEKQDIEVIQLLMYSQNGTHEFTGGFYVDPNLSLEENLKINNEKSEARINQFLADLGKQILQTKDIGTQTQLNELKNSLENRKLDLKINGAKFYGIALNGKAEKIKKIKEKHSNVKAISIDETIVSPSTIKEWSEKNED